MHIKRWLLLAVAGGLLAGCGKTDTADHTSASLDDFELVPRSVFFGNPERAQGRISPDGRHISYLAPLDGVLNVWVAPIDDPDAARAITKDTGSGIDAQWWAENSTHLLYIRDAGGDEDHHVYSVNIDSGDAIDLTPFDGVKGTFVASSHRHPDVMLLGMNNRDPRWHDVWRMNVRSGDRELVEQNDRFLGYVADLDLNLRLALEPTADGGQLVYKRSGDGDWVEFFKIEKDDSLTSFPLAFNEDGSGFYMIDSAGRDKAALLLIDIETDERTIIAESELADVNDVITDPVTNAPLAYAVNHLKTEWHALNDEASKVLEQLSGTLNGELSVVAQTLDNRRWIVANDSPTEPLGYHLFDRESGSIDALFVSRPDLVGKPLNAKHPVVITARDGLELVSYLTLPPHVDPDGDGRPNEPQPMVLDVHGGPWGRDTYGYGSWAQWLSNRGFVVLESNFRGSTGFGKSFVNAGDGEWAAAMHDDLIDAVNWAIEEGIADPNRIAIAGGSYGGYATLVGLTFTPEVFACGVDIVGPSNLVTLLESIPPYWASFIETFAQRVGDHRTEEGRMFLRSRSPLHKADQIVRPLLIGQGANDPRVKQPESDQIVAAMQANEQPVTYVLYPDEGHGFDRPENRESFYAIMEVFLADCLGGRSQPIGDALAGSSTQVPVGAEHVTGLTEALEGFTPVIAD